MNKNKYQKPELEVIFVTPLQLLADSLTFKDTMVHDATGQTTGTGGDYGLTDGNGPTQAGANEEADAKRWSGGAFSWTD